MKRILVFFVSTMICGAVAQAGDVKVKAIMTTGAGDEETTSFSPDTPKIHALFKTKGAKEGDKIRGVWMADDIGEMKAGKIDEKSVTLDGDTNDGDFSLVKSQDAWPKGQYHVDIYVNDELVTTVKFTVGGGKTTAKTAAKKDDEEEDQASNDEYSFKVHNTTKDRIKKILVSEDGEKYGLFDIGKGIPAGETVTLKWDKSTNKSDCEWLIKAVFADGSETPPKKFDFCEEDLELDF
jgi:hypothetical protein